MLLNFVVEGELNKLELGAYNALSSANPHVSNRSSINALINVLPLPPTPHTKTGEKSLFVMYL